MLLGWLAKRLWRLLVLVVRSPSIMAVLTVIAAAVAVCHRFGPVPLVTAVVVLVTSLVVAAAVAGRVPTLGPLRLAVVVPVFVELGLKLHGEGPVEGG